MLGISPTPIPSSCSSATKRILRISEKSRSKKPADSPKKTALSLSKPARKQEKMSSMHSSRQLPLSSITLKKEQLIFLHMPDSRGDLRKRQNLYIHYQSPLLQKNPAVVKIAHLWVFGLVSAFSFPPLPLPLPLPSLFIPLCFVFVDGCV